MFKKGRSAAERATGYATGCDFAEIFSTDMNRLYLAAFLLTADPSMAEQCLLNAFESCLKGTPVFDNWAHAWSKRTVIKHAIDMVALAQPSPADAGISREHQKDLSTVSVLVRAILALEPFERFAFVISVLERYSDRETSALLNCGTREVRDARTQAVLRIVNTLAHEKSAMAAAVGHEQSDSVLRWPRLAFDRGTFSQEQA